MGEQVTISNDELAVYDRQIRLWGLEAQNRLRNAKALICGMSLLGAEVAKNLMLCGLKELTIADSVEATESHFLMDYGLEGSKNRALASEKKLKTLNPMVKVEALQLPSDGIEGFSQLDWKNFDLVILIDQSEEVVKKIEEICRQLKIRFIAGGVFGWIGYAFFDFDGFEFLVPAPKNYTVVDEERETNRACANGDSVDTVTLEDDAKIRKKFDYPTFAESNVIECDQLTKGFIRKKKPGTFVLINALMFLRKQLGNNPTPKDLDYFLNDAGEMYRNTVIPSVLGKFELVLDPPLPSTCSIVGGVLSQEAIKSITQNDEPHRNFFTYNAVEAMGYVHNAPLF